MSNRASVPSAAVEYFKIGRDHVYNGQPVLISQVFRPGVGWRHVAGRQLASGQKIRRLRLDGVTAVALRFAGRLADFQIQEFGQVNASRKVGG